MPTYYVKHPSIEQDAKVEAPTSEKARTEFLDYLERHGIVGRSSRQSIRRNLASERLRDPDLVEAKVVLDYGHNVAPTYPVEVGIEPPEASLDLAKIEPTEVSADLARIEPPQILKLSPIAQVALRGRV